MQVSQFWMRALGVIGSLGGLVLFAGDMLLYYDPISTDLNQNMGHASDARITASGICGLVATWFYMIGLAQVYIAFTPSKQIIRTITIVCFGSILIAFGVVHGAFLAIATTAKLSIENHLDINKAVALSQHINQSLRLLVYPIFGILSLVFIHAVWNKNTLYPRWVILCFPLLPFLLEGIITNALPENLWVIIKGGYLNILLIIFFTASTIALWNSNPKTTAKRSTRS